MIEIVTFKKAHYIELMAGNVIEHTLSRTPAVVAATAEIFASRGPAFTAMLGREILGCAGVMIMWPGVGEAWAVFNEKVSLLFKKEAYVYAANHLYAIIKHKNLHRVQAHCRVDLPKAIRYAENLGFKREAVMEKYDEDGTDHYLYAMVIKQ